MALQETWAEEAANKKHCAPVVEELAGGRLVAASPLTKQDKNLQIEASLNLHPPLFTSKSHSKCSKERPEIPALRMN